MSWVLTLLGLIVACAQAAWDDVQKIRDHKHPDRAHSFIKVRLCCLGLLIALAGVWMQKRDGDEQVRSAESKNSVLTNEITKLRADSAEERKTYARVIAACESNTIAGAKVAASTLVGIRIKAIKDHERAFQEFSTDKFNPKLARESLSNRFEQKRLEEDKARLDAELAAPSQKEAEEKAKHEQEEFRNKNLENTLGEYSPYVDFTLNSLLGILQDRAKDVGTKTRLAWDCSDIRKLLESNGSCEIKQGEELEGVYRIAFAGFRPGTLSCHLKVTCVGKEKTNLSSKGLLPINSMVFAYTNTLEIMFSKHYDQLNISLGVSVSSGQNSYSDQTSISEYKKLVRQAVERLVVAQPLSSSKAGEGAQR